MKVPRKLRTQCCSGRPAASSQLAVSRTHVPRLVRRASMALPVLVGWGAFVGTHMYMSHPGNREDLIRQIGDESAPSCPHGSWLTRRPEKFLLVYSAVSLGTFVPTTMLWWRSRGSGVRLWNIRVRRRVISRDRQEQRCLALFNRPFRESSFYLISAPSARPPPLPLRSRRQVPSACLHPVR